MSYYQDLGIAAEQVMCDPIKYNPNEELCRDVCGMRIICRWRWRRRRLKKEREKLGR